MAQLLDAVRIGLNIAVGHLNVHGDCGDHLKGEDAVLQLYQGGGFDAIATDDARFIRRLRGLGIPFAVPAVIVVRLWQEVAIKTDQAHLALTAL